MIVTSSAAARHNKPAGGTQSELKMQIDLEDLDQIAQEVQQANRAAQEHDPDFEAWLEKVSDG